MPSRRSFLTSLCALVVVPSLAPVRKIVTSVRGKFDPGIEWRYDGTTFVCRPPTGAHILRKNMAITIRDWDEAIDGPRA